MANESCQAMKYLVELRIYNYIRKKEVVQALQNSYFQLDPDLLTPQQEHIMTTALNAEENKLATMFGETVCLLPVCLQNQVSMCNICRQVISSISDFESTET